ncbi:MAG: hypothetical protein DMG41_17080 [Acidobacteria bacterium]|nr:MAG: hypothetical protein DMG41_17080 [Acidobacteriota bacterium]
MHTSLCFPPNTAEFDSVSALENWVEKGQAPDKCIACRSMEGIVERSRPIFPYPVVARCSGKGDQAIRAKPRVLAEEGMVDSVQPEFHRYREMHGHRLPIQARRFVLPLAHRFDGCLLQGRRAGKHFYGLNVAARVDQRVHHHVSADAR